jgi:hypothetical protein
VPDWAAPALALAVFAVVGILDAQAHRVHGVRFALLAVLAVCAATFGGMSLPPTAFRVARRQSDAGDPLSVPEGSDRDVPTWRDLPSTPEPLRGGRMIGVLERAAVSGAILSGWPEGLIVILGVKSLARYPDLRDSKVSEQFIIGTFTSVLWSVAVSAAVRRLLH